MNGVLVFLIIGGAVAGIWLIQTAIGKSVSAVDRTVRRKTHAAGRAETASTLTFSAPVAPQHLVAAIVAKVNAHSTPPALVPGLYLKKQTELMAQFAYGGRAGGDLFGAVVRLSPSPSGCSGQYEVLHWTESGADISGRDEMAKMRTRIADAVRESAGVVQMA